MQTYSADELERLERASGLHLAGYVLAGEPAALVPVFLRPDRAPAERRRLVLELCGQVEPPARVPTSPRSAG